MIVEMLDAARKILFVIGNVKSDLPFSLGVHHLRKFFCGFSCFLKLFC